MAENIYYNANLICQKINATDPDLPAKYFEDRSGPIVTNATTYEFTITRATVESMNIPILIPKIDTTQSNPNVCVYKLQLSASVKIGSTVTTYKSAIVPLTYVCRNKYVNDSVSDPSVNGQTNSQYYFMFNLQDFVDMFNVGLNIAQASLVAAATAGGVSLVTTVPKMCYSANLFSIYYDSWGYGNSDAKSTGTGQVEWCSLSVNDPLYNLLRNFNSTFIPSSGNAMDWQFIVSNKMNNNATIGSKNYYVETQSYESVSNLWSPVSSIVFYSNMGIRSEYIGTTQVLNGQNTVESGGNNFELNIGDIVLPLDNSMDYNSYIVYSPVIYRYSDIIVDEIRNIDISLYWKSKNGILYNIMLSDGCSMSIKMLFRKKF